MGVSKANWVVLILALALGQMGCQAVLAGAWFTGNRVFFACMVALVVAGVFTIWKFWRMNKALLDACVTPQPPEEE